MRRARRSRSVALLALALACASCGGAKRPPGGEPDAATDEAALGPAAPVTWAEVGPRTTRVTLGLAPGDSLVFARPTPGLSTWLVSRHAGDSSTAVDAVVSRDLRAGTVDLHAGGTRDVFFVTESGGSGLHTRELDLFCPLVGRVLTLSMTFVSDLTQPVAAVLRSDELERPEHHEDARFLEAVKRDFGYVGPEDLETRADDPRFAYYFWARDNAELPDGEAMRVRRYPGRDTLAGSVLDSLEAGGVLYRAQFRAGVTAYDSARRERWVVFHPSDPYRWPTCLARAGDVLVIGTHGEGLALVHLPSLRLKRVTLPGEENVERLAVVDSVLVVNGRARMVVPAF